MTEETETFIPNLGTTPELQAWCADNLAGLGTRIKFTTDTVEHYVDRDGRQLRLAGKLMVAPGHNDWITIQLRTGASSEDLARLKRIARNAQAGIFHDDLWTRVDFINQGYPGWVMRCYLSDGEEFERDVLRECVKPGCIEQFHAWVGDWQKSVCVADKITTDVYTIEVVDHGLGDGWEVYSDLDGFTFESAEDIKVLDRFRNDFMYLLGERDRLNQQPYLKEAA